MAFAFAMAVFAGIASSLIATLVTARIPAWTGMRADASGRVGTWGATLRHGFVVLQVAAAFTMVTASLLLVRTLVNLHAVPLGFEPANVSVFGYNASPQGYNPVARRALDQRLLSAVQLTPGIESAALGTALPMMTGMNHLVTADGAATKVQAVAFEVTADYFETLKLPLISGTGFAEHDQFLSSIGRGVVLSKTAGAILFPDIDPTGKMVSVRQAGKPVQYPVLGVTDEARLRGHRSPPTPAIYLPIADSVQSMRYLLVRSELPAHEARRVVAETLARLDSNIPFVRVQPLDDIVTRPIAEERLLAILLGGCGAMAAFLAAVGIYGMMAYAARLRRKEIGIRLAVGADSTGVTGLMMRQTMTVLALGTVLGLVGAYGAAQLLASRVFGFTPLDPAVAAGAFLLVSVISVTASLVPTLRTARVNVVDALKAD